MPLSPADRCLTHAGGAVLATPHEAAKMHITTRAGERLPVHAAAVEILPGVHVAAFAAW
jgi:hypothetical protein